MRSEESAFASSAVRSAAAESSAMPAFAQLGVGPGAGVDLALQGDQLGDAALADPQVGLQHREQQRQGDREEFPVQHGR